MVGCSSGHKLFSHTEALRLGIGLITTFFLGSYDAAFESSRRIGLSNRSLYCALFFLIEYMAHFQLSQDQLDRGVVFFSLLQRVVSKVKQRNIIAKIYSGVQQTISLFAGTVLFLSFVFWLVLKLRLFLCFAFLVYFDVLWYVFLIVTSLLS